MKRLFALMAAVLTAVFMNIPFSNSAEAARVAVVPIQIDETRVERSADFSGYYWDIMIDKFKYPDYELMDDEKVAEAVPEEGLKACDKATMAELSVKTDAEIVVFMRLDEVKEKPLNFRREPLLETFMKGEFASYNRFTDNYIYKKIYYKGTIEEVLTLRTDWQQNVFASELKRCINRTIDTKKKK